MALFIEISAKVRGGKTPLRLKTCSGFSKNVGQKVTHSPTKVGSLLFAVARRNIWGPFSKERILDDFSFRRTLKPLMADDYTMHLKKRANFPEQLTRAVKATCCFAHQVVCVAPWVACYCRHCDDIGPSVIPPFTRKKKKMIAYPSMPLKARCLYIVYPSQSTPDHLY